MNIEDFIDDDDFWRQVLAGVTAIVIGVSLLYVIGVHKT